MNPIRAFVLLLISTAGLPAAGPIQDLKDARTVLSEVAKTMGAGWPEDTHYSGAGSSYVVTPGPVPADGRPHSVMKSYVRDINLEAKTSRLQLVRAEGTPLVEKTLTHEVDANSPWSSRNHNRSPTQRDAKILFPKLVKYLANYSSLEPYWLLGPCYQWMFFAPCRCRAIYS